MYYILSSCSNLFRKINSLFNTVLLLRFAAQYFTGRKGSRQHPCFGKLEVALSVKPTEGEELDIERGRKEHRRPALPAQRAASQLQFLYPDPVHYSSADGLRGGRSTSWHKKCFYCSKPSKGPTCLSIVLFCCFCFSVKKRMVVLKWETRGCQWRLTDQGKNRMFLLEIFEVRVAS